MIFTPGCLFLDLKVTIIIMDVQGINHSNKREIDRKREYLIELKIKIQEILDSKPLVEAYKYAPRLSPPAVNTKLRISRRI